MNWLLIPVTSTSKELKSIIADKEFSDEQIALSSQSSDVLVREEKRSVSAHELDDTICTSKESVKTVICYAKCEL